MKNSDFWVVTRKDASVSRAQTHLCDTGKKFPSRCIVEITPDEIAYVWPHIPRFPNLCLICRNLNHQSISVCKTNIIKDFLCSFVPVPETVLPDDFEDFLIDGEYIAECGYFYSFEDFKRLNGCTEGEFDSVFLGNLPSIRAARSVLTNLCCSFPDLKK